MTTSGRFQLAQAGGAARVSSGSGCPSCSSAARARSASTCRAGAAFGASFAIDEAFVVLAGTLLATAAFLLVTLLYGRVWCGWSCPQTVLGDLALGGAGRRAAASVAAADRARARRARLRGRRRERALVLRLPTSSSAGSPPARSAVLGWSWLALAAVLFADLAAVRGSFCATVCPYAKLQGVLFDRHTLVVAYDRHRADDCVDCGACACVCPTIDIRDGLQMECIACAACVDACAPIMAKLRRPPGLVRYSFGEPGTPRRLRPGIVALAGATAAALVLVVAVVAGRAVDALAEAAFVPRRADGRVVNVFSVALENRAAVR